MTHTFYKNYYHLVWSTKDRLPLILPEHKTRVFEYLGGSLKSAGCTPLQIGGMNDHVHLLVGIPPKFAVSEIIRDIKIASSKWVASSLSDSKNFSWQEGFGSFSVSVSQIEMVRAYVCNQEKHHKTRSFKNEFIDLLKYHEIEFEEKYLWQ